MKTEFKAWLVFVGFIALFWSAVSSTPGGAWFHVGEAAATVVIMLGASGLIAGRGFSGSR